MEQSGLTMATCARQQCQGIAPRAGRALERRSWTQAPAGDSNHLPVLPGKLRHGHGVLAVGTREQPGQSPAGQRTRIHTRVHSHTSHTVHTRSSGSPEVAADSAAPGPPCLLLWSGGELCPGHSEPPR